MIYKDYANYLRDALAAIQKNDHEQNYTMRARNIYQAMTFATDLGYPCGFRIDPQEPDWPVAFIELPTGQVSWHMQQHANAWDGHTTEEKYHRVGRFQIGQMHRRE